MWAGAVHCLRSFRVFFGIVLPPADRGQPGGTAGSLWGSWGACGLQLSPGTAAVAAAAIPPEVRFILGDSPITRKNGRISSLHWRLQFNWHFIEVWVLISKLNAIGKALKQAPCHLVPLISWRKKSTIWHAVWREARIWHYFIQEPVFKDRRMKLQLFENRCKSVQREKTRRKREARGDYVLSAWSTPNSFSELKKKNTNTGLKYAFSITSRK